MSLARTRVAVLSLVLAVLVSPFLVSCFPHKKPAGVAVRPSDPPALRLLSGDQTLTALRNGFRWPSDTTIREVGENPFVPLPDDRLFVWPGQEILFRLEGTPHKPDTVTLGLFPHHDFVDPERPRQVICGGEVTDFLAEGNAFTFKWRLPQDLLPASAYRGDAVPEYDVHVTVKWTRPQDAEVRYVAVLASPDEPSVKAVLDTCRRFFDAAWSGRKEALVEMIHPEALKRREAAEATARATSSPGMEPSPFRLSLDSPWDLVLWRSAEYSFKLTSGPKVRLRSMYPSKTGPYAQVEISYTVDATEAQTGGQTRWDYTETYLLLGGGDKWLVRDMTRGGVPWEFAGGREKGWEVTAVRNTLEGHALVQVGDFTNVGGRKWSDDRQFLAFTAENFWRKELWVVRRDGTGLRRLLCLEDLPSAGIRLSNQEMLILDWAPQQHKVRFLVSGHQVTGPHAEEYGHWVGEADADTGQIEDVAFVPLRSPGYPLPGDVSVTRDRTAVMLRSVRDLWRVTFEDRKASLLVPNVRPEGYDLFRLHYSPSGWYAAYLDYTYAPGGYRIPVYDLRTGEKRLIEIAGAKEAFFTGWTPAEMLTVVVAAEKEINREVDDASPAGARSLRFYHVHGELKAEVLVPPGRTGESIGHWAWTSDGKALAFTTGKVVQSDDITSMGDPLLVHRASEVWIWEDPVGNSRAGSAGRPRKLADISGIVESMEWGPSHEYVDIWYRVPRDDPRPEQIGVRVSMDGKVTARSRPRPYGPALDRDLLIGSLGGKEYFQRAGKEGSRIFVRDSLGRDTVLLEGEFWVRDARIDQDALVVETETSRHALVINRSRVYLIVP